MHLTLADRAKFHRVFLTEGGGLFRPETIEQLVTPAPGCGRRMSPGWAMVSPKTGASLAQQGSNTLWVATAVVDAARARTVMLVANDGRPRLLHRSVPLALQLVSEV